MSKLLIVVVVILFCVIVIIGIFFILNLRHEKGGDSIVMFKDFEKSSVVSSENLNITVIYDNNPYKEGLETAWGFSCIVKGTEKTILFDTGGDGSVLMENMGKLKINPDVINLVVLSHVHGDHVGGLFSFLEENSKATVYVLSSFPENFKGDIEKNCSKIVDVKDPLELCSCVYSTGELGTFIKEQSLIIRTNKGLIVITGCAHPGIVEIVSKAKDLTGDDVLFVMGGFHLGDKSREEIEEIVSSLKDLGVQYVGPCHCSGDTAREIFEKEYGKNFINIGVGKEISIYNFSNGI